MVTVISHTDPAEVEELLWLGYRHCQMGYDIGANCGQSIIPMLQFCAAVVAFEPNEDAYAEMERRYGKSGVEMHQLAVSDHEGNAALAQLPGKQQQTGQLVTHGLKGMEWDPGDWNRVPVLHMPCRTVDSFAGESKKRALPGFIKVDTEGHEAQVLRGAALTMASCRPEWLIEFHSPLGYEQCMRMLANAHYKVETVRHPHYAKGSPMWHQHGWIRAFPR